MQLYDIEFLFCFLPLIIGIYSMGAGRWRSFVLAAASLLYYAFSCGGAYWQVAVLVLLCVVTYYLGRLLGGKGRTLLFVLGAGVLIAGLGFLKLYEGGKWMLPGFSFILLQITAYLTDIYRNKIEPEKGLIRYSAGVLMFPKLLSGPLVTPSVLYGQKQGNASKASFRRGLHELIWGLAFKVILADRFGALWSQGKVIGYDGISTPFAWMLIGAFSLQLYFDFYGYSLMAVGLGRMLGIRLPQNFDSPYASRSVSEFYRRWHITLGAWFRDYIYIPLGGSRKGTLRTVLNLCVVWLATGFWHGTSTGYFLWAGALCILIVNEKLWLGRILKKSRIFSHIYLVLVIMLSWVPFAVQDPMQMQQFFKCLFGLSVRGWNDIFTWGEGYLPLFAVGAFMALPASQKLWRKLQGHWFADLFLFVLFWIVVYNLATAQQNPFLYFQF